MILSGYYQNPLWKDIWHLAFWVQDNNGVLKLKPAFYLHQAKFNWHIFDVLIN